MNSTEQQARTAGWLYLLVALSAPFGLLYVPAKLVEPGNATATADNIRASELLLRIGIASELVHQVVGPLQFGELPIIFWLLIWGARVPSAAARAER